MDYFGYIDPGTGSVFLQAIIGFLLGAIVIFKSFFVRVFYKLKSKFSRAKTDEKDSKQ